MNWLFMGGNGNSASAGTRPGDDSANGNAVMYDARNGKILTIGGSSAFSQPEFPGTGDTVIITLQGTGQSVQTRVVDSLNNPRVYANSMVLPDGKVATVGGSEVPKEFDDSFPVFETGVHRARARTASLVVCLCDIYIYVCSSRTTSASFLCDASGAMPPFRTTAALLGFGSPILALLEVGSIVHCS